LSIVNGNNADFAKIPATPPHAASAPAVVTHTATPGLA
jgi:hypothetical protein